MSTATRPDARDNDSSIRLRAVVEQLLAELRSSAARRVRVSPGSDLEADLGLDSLARVELLRRVEREFGCRLPDDAVATARSPAELLELIRTAHAAPLRRSMSATRSTTATSADPSSEEEPSHAVTLLEALAWHVREHPARTQIILAADEGDERIDFATLDREARAVAGGLLSLDLGARECVAIMLPTGADYFYAFLGTLLAGAIPVPIYPPFRPAQIEDHVRRHAGILGNAQARILITVPQARTVAHLLEAHVPELRGVATVESLREAGASAAAPPPHPTDIAFLQYTSGSTGDPKGVEITHAGLLANIRAIGEALQIRTSDVFVSWLPLYHDMGLISAWLASLYYGNPLVAMSPLAFLSRPERWLWAIHRYRGTLTAAPNFAYEFCVGRIDEDSIEGLDLSSLRLAANGAEPVSADTLQRFAERYAPHGLRPGVIAPVYGLAEATVGLTCPPMGRGLVVDCVERDHFQATSEARAVDAAAHNPLRFVACGPPLPGMEIRVVDATGTELGERTEGRLEFRGPSATPGYHRAAEKTAELVHGDWLDTGDRAYIAGGDLYVTGRVKDIIIRGGRNLYPQEIEATVGEVDGVRMGCVAVFGSAREGTGTEQLVVLAESRVTDEQELQALHARVSEAVLRLLGEPADEVLLVSPHTVLKTSSGKVRRAASKALFERGELGKPSRAAWWQFLRLVFTARRPAWKQLQQATGAYLYAARFWSALALVLTPTWLLTSLLRSPALVWRISRPAGKLALWLAGIRVVTRGLEHLPHGRPTIVVANHQSYLDGLVVLVSLRDPLSFVAKRELASQRVAGTYLRRLGATFVERFDVSASVGDANALARAGAQGQQRLGFFPEGTFSRAPGLQPFHLGAFTAAVTNHLAVVPIAIRGTRSILRDTQRLPRRGIVTVTVTAPIEPSDTPLEHFAEAVRLRDLARAQILDNCGEPDLLM